MVSPTPLGWLLFAVGVAFWVIIGLAALLGLLVIVDMIWTGFMTAAEAGERASW